MISSAGTCIVIKFVQHVTNIELLDSKRYEEVFAPIKESDQPAHPCADPVGEQGSGPQPPKNHKNVGFRSNTGPDPLKNHITTKPAFNVGPSSSARQ